MKYSPAAKLRNKEIAAAYGCILHPGEMDGLDPAHWPLRRSQGAGWGLLEFVPLCRVWHRRLDTGDPVAAKLVDVAARVYYRQMLQLHPMHYLGPEERVAEVKGSFLEG